MALGMRERVKQFYDRLSLALDQFRDRREHF